MTVAKSKNNTVSSSSSAKELFTPRDISWLEFNSRVLEEAFDESVPLLERVKFLAIFSSNLDEFFMVRMAGLSQQDPLQPRKLYKEHTYIPGELLSVLEKRISSLVSRQYRHLNGVVIPALSREGIRISPWKNLSQPGRDNARKILEREILPVLTPVAVDPTHPFPLVPNLSLELLVRLVKGSSGKASKGGKAGADEVKRFAVVEVPPVVPRFISVEEPSGQVYVPAEDIVANNLDALFSGCRILECSAFRITRDMDFSIDEESIDDLLSEMRTAMLKKTERSVVRLETDRNMSGESLGFLREKLKVKESQIYRIPGLLNLKSLFQLASLPGFPQLCDAPMPPLDSISCPSGRSMFETVRENGPFTLQLPYESFTPVVRLLEEAALDPDVLAIKQTLYRVSGNSPIVSALIKAARNGKQVSVLFEIKARFDEENNMRMAHALAEAGAHVVYGIAGLKVHCKALLIVRREEDGIRRYVHLSTGNYNDRTAKQYTDTGYFSDDQLLAADVAGLFNVITGFSDPPVWNSLLVAPFSMKDKIIYMIDREARLSSLENPGHITIKANAVIDYEVIEHLYKAAEHHVKIDMIVRGICGLNPFALSPSAAKNFRIVSILDRFLEHSRIYIFNNNGSPEYFLGSADLMPRNLRRRIEILFPVDDEKIRAELDVIVSAGLNDKRKGRRLTAANTYSHSGSALEKYAPSRSQNVIRAYIEERFLRYREQSRPGKGRLTVYRGKASGSGASSENE